MSRKRKQSSCLSKIINFIFTTFLVVLTAFGLQMYFGNSAQGATTLNFAQISDTHLSYDDKNYSYRLTANSRELLEDAINEINSTKNLDFVFFTGDVIDIPYEKHLKMFFEYANKLKYPYYNVPGNHDICVGGYLSKKLYVDYMQKYNKNFKFNKTYYSFTPKTGYKIIALDSIIDSRITANGELSKEQLEFLDKELSLAGDNIILIFMHMPLKQPFSSDNHRLLNSDEMYKVLLKYNNPIALFTGHYHTTRIMQENNLIHVSTPALISYPNAYRYVKIDDYKDKVVFKIQYAPTRLKDLQKKSKLLVFHSSIYYGDEKDRTVTITINKGKKNDK